MSFYYKYKFTSPEGIYAVVQEDLKSYFSTGAVDSLMFPTYLNKALDRLGKGTYYITEDLLDIEDFYARLPDNFYAVREAWMCTEVDGRPYQTPNSFYSQAASQTTIQVSPLVTGAACNNVDCTDEDCQGGCLPELIQAVYKTNNEVTRSYQKAYLLKPGNISVKKHCDLDCKNFYSDSIDSFDIRDNKFVTNFRTAKVYLIFYATEYDSDQNQMIPDNFRIKEYIEAYLKYKIFETLSNQINDETFQQIMQKMQYYKQQSDEAFILANVELMKQTSGQKMMAIKAQKKSFRQYELPTRRFIKE